MGSLRVAVAPSLLSLKKNLARTPNTPTPDTPTRMCNTAADDLLHREQPVRHGNVQGAILVELHLLHHGQPHPGLQAGRHERAHDQRGGCNTA